MVYYQMNYVMKGVASVVGGLVIVLANREA
jgi:hypothetical protein